MGNRKSKWFLQLRLTHGSAKLPPTRRPLGFATLGCGHVPEPCNCVVPLVPRVRTSWLPSTPVISKRKQERGVTR